MSLGMVCEVGNVDIRINGIVGMIIGGIMNLKKMLVFGLTVMLLTSVVSVAIGDGFEDDVRSDELMGDVIEVYTWEDLHNMRDDLTANYTLMNDLGPSDPGYDDHNERRDDYTKEEDAGWDQTWDEGDTIDLIFDEDDYGSILVEDDDGDPVSHTVGEDVITIDEDTGERYLYVIYEDALVGWLPIGENPGWPVHGEAFTGTFYGQNYTLTGLYINRPNTNHVGLFGWIGEEGEVRNIGVIEANARGTNGVGGLVGWNAGTVENSYAVGNVSGISNVGVLAGGNRGMIENSYAVGNVSGIGNLGGLVGRNEGGGTVSNSYATGSASGTGNDIGGLVGGNSGTVSNSYATGSANGTGNNVGGLAGGNGGTVTNSYATGSASGTGSNVGGLVGGNGWGSTIENSYATGNVSGEENAGGLMGRNDGTISNSFYNIDSVLINDGNHITRGGLFNEQYEDWFYNGLFLDIEDYADTLVPIGDSYEINSADGLRDLLGFAEREGYNFSLASDIDLSGEPGLYIPYITAEFNGNNYTISNLHIDLPFVARVGMFGYVNDGIIRDVGLVDVDVNGSSRVGGLVGWNEWSGTVSNSYATGTVSGNEQVGGLVGYSGGMVSNSYATANVSGDRYVGGLVGFHSYHTIENSYATGNVVGNSWAIGGLVGEIMSSTAVNSYATGSVNGNQSVGGFVGTNWYSTIERSYATGTVSGENDVGGFVGYIYGGTSDPLSNSYSTGNVSGNEHVGGFVGLNNGRVSNSYSTGNVSGDSYVGGFLGRGGVVENSFWDIETSGMNESDGGEGKTTAEMMDIATFTDAGWDINNIWYLRPDGTEYIALTWQMEVSYIISDVWELDLVRLDLSGDYVLASDIDANETSGWNGGDGWSPIGSGPWDATENHFTGTFDGGNHNISGLYINRSDGDYVGFFGFVGDDGETGNVGLVDLMVSGDRFVGGLTGSHRGMVFNSYSTGNVSGNKDIGGLLGFSSGSVENSYSMVSVSGNNDVGGLVGSCNGTVDKSYAMGNVSGNEDVGGLVGSSSGTVSNSFYDMETTGQSDTGKGVPKTTAEMKDVATFTNLSTEGLDEPWDFFGNPYDDLGEEYIWDIKEEGIFNDGYPFLSWQRLRYALTINMSGMGTIYINNDEVVELPHHDHYVVGTELQLEAEPKPGFEFVEWQGDFESQEQEINITISDHMTLTAVFELEYEPVIVDIYPGQDESVSGYGMVFSARLNHPGEIDIEYATVTLLDTGLEFEANTVGNVSVMNMPFVMDEGWYTYEIYMVDAYGNEHYTEVSFYVDNSAPLLEITSPADGVEELTYEEDFTIEGSTEPGVSLWINDVFVDVDEYGNFSYQNTLVEGMNVFNVIAEDQAGNTAQTTVYALYLPQIPEILEAIDALEDGIQENRDNITALQEELEALDIDLGHLTDRVDALEDALAENITALENAIDENRDDITNIQDNITSIWDEMQSLEKDIENIWSHIGEIDDSIVNIRGYIEHLNETTDDLWVEIGDVEFNLTGKIDALQMSMEENVTALETLISENAYNISAVQDDITDIYGNITTIWDELQELDDEIISIWTSINDLFDALGSTLTEDEIHSLLQDYLKAGDLEAVLEDYLTQEEIDTLLESYITEARLEEHMGEYLTDDEISEILDNYVSNASLEEMLGDYLSDAEIYELMGTMFFDIMSELEGTLDEYVLHSDLERELEEQDDDTVSLLTMIGLIAAVLAILIALFAVFKKGGANGEQTDAEGPSMDQEPEDFPEEEVLEDDLIFD